jgi:hypothetical protein
MFFLLLFIFPTPQLYTLLRLPELLLAVSSPSNATSITTNHSTFTTSAVLQTTNFLSFVAAILCSLIIFLFRMTQDSRANLISVNDRK